MDLRAVYGLSINDISLTGPVTPGEALHLLEALLKDTGTHYFAAVTGWAYPLSRTDTSLQLLAQWALNLLREGEPLSLDWPWEGKEEVPVVTDEERLDLRAALDATSAFGQIRQSVQ